MAQAKMATDVVLFVVVVVVVVVVAVIVVVVAGFRFVVLAVVALLGLDVTVFLVAVCWAKGFMPASRTHQSKVEPWQIGRALIHMLVQRTNRRPDN